MTDLCQNRHLTKYQMSVKTKSLNSYQDLPDLAESSRKLNCRPLYAFGLSCYILFRQSLMKRFVV